MDIGSVLLALALLLIVAAFVARPIIDRTARNGEDASPASTDALVAQREAILIELRDLDFEHSTGKVSEDDFENQRARLVAKGTEILRALDQVAAQSGQSLGSSSTADEDIERLVRARRKGSARERLAQASAAPAPVVPLCPNCHQPIKSNDKFCAKCGAKISLAEAA